MKYFDIRDIIAESPNTHIFNIIGQGGVGKSYSAKKYVLLRYFETGEKFVYVRRWTTEITSGMLASVFTDVETDEEVIYAWNGLKLAEKYETFHILPRSGWFWLVGEKLNTEIDYLYQIGRIACLSKATMFKGGTYNEFKTIIADEIITDEGYVGGDSEPQKLDKIVNTVARAINEIKLILCGNPDANIEACPYFTNLRLDYAHLQANTVYYFDSRTRNGKILANNVAFIKLSNFERDTDSFLNEYTANIWDTPEGEMRLTGEVKTNRFPQIEKIGTNAIRPYYKIILETPILARNEFRRKLHIYYGFWKKEPCIAILTHSDGSLDARLRSENILYSRYDMLDIREREHKQMFRLNIPPMERYRKMRDIIACVESNRFYFTDSNNAATLFFEILNQDN